MSFKIDLHVHTVNSGDNNADPEETIEAAIEQKLDGVAITEHYSYEASEHVEKLREKYRGKIALLRGVEFSAAEGHCLIFGVNTDTLAMKYAPIREVIRKVGEAGGVVIPSHPFRGVNSAGELLLDLPGLAGVEGYNGANMHAMNVKAIDIAKRLGLPFTGGSDAHAPSEVGSCYTEFEASVTIDNFLERMKEGRFHGVDTRKISRGVWP